MVNLRAPDDGDVHGRIKVADIGMAALGVTFADLRVAFRIFAWGRMDVLHGASCAGTK